MCLNFVISFRFAWICFHVVAATEPAVIDVDDCCDEDDDEEEEDVCELDDVADGNGDVDKPFGRIIIVAFFNV